MYPELHFNDHVITCLNFIISGAKFRMPLNHEDLIQRDFLSCIK